MYAFSNNIELETSFSLPQLGERNTRAKLVDVVTMVKQHDVIIYFPTRYRPKGKHDAQLNLNLGFKI